MSDTESAEATAAEPSSPDGATDAEVQTRLELLEAENERLRSEYARARQNQYQRTALGLGGTGVVAALGGVLFPAAQTVLFALAGTGVFLAVLTYYLTPEQFLPASLSRTVYGALATNEARIVTELGLRDERVYVPTADGIRLFVPQHAEYSLPDDSALADVFVVTDEADPRGLSLEPTGDGLADEFERAVTAADATDTEAVAAQASDALVEQFELVDSATVDVDPSGGRLTVAVDESAYGDIDRFDHPVVSFLGSVVARRVDEPVTAKTEGLPSDTGYRITLAWPAAPEPENEGPDTAADSRES